MPAQTLKNTHLRFSRFEGKFPFSIKVQQNQMTQLLRAMNSLLLLDIKRFLKTQSSSLLKRRKRSSNLLGAFKTCKKKNQMESLWHSTYFYSHERTHMIRKETQTFHTKLKEKLQIRKEEMGIRKPTNMMV